MASASPSPIRVVDHGDSAANSLFSALYTELHRLAKRQLARRGGLVGVSVTTLLHEAYIDMSARTKAQFPDEARFMGYAARVMRGIIIDHARSHSAIKRGGEFEITALENHDVENPVDARCKPKTNLTRAMQHSAPLRKTCKHRGPQSSRYS